MQFSKRLDRFGDEIFAALGKALDNDRILLSE